jgi:hypothetical protein
MSRIVIEATRRGVGARVTVVEISETDGIYALSCSGDPGRECPSDLEPGDTWSDFEDCVQSGIRHIGNHEMRVCAECGEPTGKPYTVPTFDGVEWRMDCPSCGHVEALQ